jgi:predicted DNA-binding transcriptional regulator YafY
MQSEYGAPIEIDRKGRNIYYKYDDPSFSILEVAVTDEDMLKLDEAVTMLQQIKGLTIGNDIGAVVQRIAQKYKIRSENAGQIIHFEDAPDNDFLEDVFHSILRKNVLKVIYKKFRDAQPRTYIIHPYLLKEYQKRWYLLGYSEERQAARIFALDRIRDIKVVPGIYRENDIITNEIFFKDVIGVTVTDSPPEIVKLWFSPEVAPFINTKPLHHSQFTESIDEKGLLITLNVVINPELINILLSYGKDVRVMGPERLKSLMRSHAEQMIKIYG